MQHCDFCNEFSGGKENSFADRYQLPSRVVGSTANFSVIPTIGQIVEGYLLVIPVRHYTALADMPADLMSEVSELCRRVRRTLSQAYGPSLLFEHGIRGAHAGGCGVEHAHLHVVPFAPGNDPIEKLKTNHSFKTIGGISDLRQQVSPNSPYLYYEQTNGQAWMCEIEHIPSQYIRRLLATSIGVELWNWRECGREQRLLSSISRLSGLFLGDSSVRAPTTEDSSAQTAAAATSGAVLQQLG